MTYPIPPKSCAVCTPPPLADAVVRALGDEPGSMWLEPCVGHGVFLRALADMGVDSNRVIAIDISQAEKPTDALARTLRGIDFLTWSRRTERRFDKIVANPPYIALTKLAPTLQQAALAVTAPGGENVSLSSNYWYAFVCAGLTLLRSGGDACFILPAAWDYADYAAPLRGSIAASFAHFETHRSRRPMFDSVQDGCVIIIGRGFGQPNEDVVRFEYDSVDVLVTALQNGHFGSARSTKAAMIRPPAANISSRDWCQLQDVLVIRLGGVTGDAGYFLLTESERIKRKLPLKSVRPVLSKARHLISGELTQQEWVTLRDKGERVWLFDPPPSVVNHPAVQAYLNLDASAGGCRRDRQKIKNREPWYRTPLPRRVDGFISGMTQLGPWICLRAMPRLTATNTLYTVRFSGSLSPDEKAAWALSLLTTRSRRLLEIVGRVYPEGLLKFEPGDLLDFSVPIPPRANGARERYLHAVKMLLSGDVEKCQDLADHWFE